MSVFDFKRLSNVQPICSIKVEQKLKIKRKLKKSYGADDFLAKPCSDGQAVRADVYECACSTALVRV